MNKINNQKQHYLIKKKIYSIYFLSKNKLSMNKKCQNYKNLKINLQNININFNLQMLIQLLIHMNFVQIKILILLEKKKQNLMKLNYLNQKLIKQNKYGNQKLVVVLIQYIIMMKNLKNFNNYMVKIIKVKEIIQNELQINQFNFNLVDNLIHLPILKELKVYLKKI